MQINIVNANIFVDYLCERSNSIFKSSMFPNSLKLADAKPLHKKGRKELNKKYQCDFRKGYSPAIRKC